MNEQKKIILKNLSPEEQKVIASLNLEATHEGDDISLLKKMIEKAFREAGMDVHLFLYLSLLELESDISEATEKNSLPNLPFDKPDLFNDLKLIPLEEAQARKAGVELPFYDKHTDTYYIPASFTRFFRGGYYIKQSDGTNKLDLKRLAGLTEIEILNIRTIGPQKIKELKELIAYLVKKVNQ